jgi:hypothetical protein
MKTTFVRFGIFATAAALLSAYVWVAGAAAQNGTTTWATGTEQGKPKPTPRMSDGHPDLTGFWVRGVAGIPGYGKEALGQASNLVRTSDGSLFLNYNGTVPSDKPAPAPVPQGAPRSAPSYKPEYAAKVAQLMATMNGNATPLDPMQQCKPLGIPRAGLGVDEHIMVVASPKAAAFLWEADPGPIYRLIYLDGRQHPTDLDTSYMGHSIGHWDGDALVVDVVGLNDETWLGGGTQGPRNALIHSDKEHVLEHWTRTGDDLVYEATIEDPVMFTKPWVMTPEHTHLATAGDYIQPQMCVNNDRTHLVAPDPNAPGGGGE